MASTTTNSSLTDINDIAQTLESNRTFKETVINLTKEYIHLRNIFISQFLSYSLIYKNLVYTIIFKKYTINII